MDGAAHVTSRQEAERITCVHGERRVLRLDVLPLARFVVLDLKRCNRLPEEKSPRAEVCERSALSVEEGRMDVPVWPCTQSLPILVFSSGVYLLYFM